MFQNESNQAIRMCLEMNNMKHWELAEKLNMSESTLCRKLRKELPPEEQKKILSIIKGCKG